MMISCPKLPPLLRIGFRPFFLGASLWAVLSLVIWLFNLFGCSGHLIGGLQLPPYIWHAHEMVFGFVFAVIAGFLLTASHNWTGFNPAKGIFLAFLILFWGAGRIFFYAGNLYSAAIFDSCFNFFLLFAVTKVIFKAKRYRNFILLFLLALPAFFNLFFYAITLFSFPFDPLLPCEVSLAVFLMFVLVIAGRIIPIFSPNAISSLTLKPTPVVTPLSLIFGSAAFLLWSFSIQTISPQAALICASIFSGAFIFNFFRLLSWKPWCITGNMMLFMLYLSYGWILISFLFMIFESFGLMLRTMTVHAIGVGGISTAIAAMICRVSRGHTGRKITAEKAEIFFFYMISLAALLRLLSGLPSVISNQTFYLALLTGSASCFILGFSAFLWRYTPFLCAERADGKNG